jgi:hypothetical protein
MMKVTNILKSIWKSVRWYSRKFFNFLLGRTPMRLPTLTDGKIDKNRVTHVCLCVINGIRTISMVVDGYPVWFAETTELNNWFKLSGIFIEDRTTAESIYNFTPQEIEESKKYSEYKPT